MGERTFEDMSKAGKTFSVTLANGNEYDEMSFIGFALGDFLHFTDEDDVSYFFKKETVVLIMEY